MVNGDIGTEALLTASRERAVMERAAADAKAALALTLSTSGGRQFGQAGSFNSPLRLAQLIDNQTGSLGFSDGSQERPLPTVGGGLAPLVALRDEMNASWNSALDATMRTAAQTSTPDDDKAGRNC